MKLGQTLNVVASGEGVGKSIFWSERMNERIKEFAEQCVGSRPYNTFDYEKFAELIVKECVRYFNEDYQRDFDNLWREDLSKGIKNHFGVKE